MSCSPLSELLARVERYEYALAKASSVSGESFDELLDEVESNRTSTADARSGIASSALFE